MRSGIAAMAVLLASPAPALAQSDELDRKVAERIEQAHQVYGVPDPRLRCRPGSDGEIVVCADHGADLKVPSTAESDPNSREARRALDGNVPTAPDLEPHYPGMSVAKGCFVPPCPPPPVYYIDMKAIPEPPEGSDADKIAKGEMPAP
jgi:hypothetical protein